MLQRMDEMNRRIYLQHQVGQIFVSHQSCVDLPKRAYWSSWIRPSLSPSIAQTHVVDRLDKFVYFLTKHCPNNFFTNFNVFSICLNFLIILVASPKAFCGLLWRPGFFLFWLALLLFFWLALLLLLRFTTGAV
jgi:hypothetical protein